MEFFSLYKDESAWSPFLETPVHSILFPDGLWLMHKAVLIDDQIPRPQLSPSATWCHVYRYSTGRNYSCKIKLPLLHRVWLLSIYSDRLLASLLSVIQSGVAWTGNAPLWASVCRRPASCCRSVPRWGLGRDWIMKADLPNGLT